MRSGLSWVNLTLVLVLEERWPEAAAAARRAFEEIAVTRREPHLAPAHAAALPCAAAAGDWDAFDHHLREAEAGLFRWGKFEDDGVWPLERAASIARHAGQAERADRANAVAARVRREVEAQVAGAGPATS